MPKVNKLALVRLTLQATLRELDKRELLCVLTDLYAGGVDKDQPRWFGNGTGTNGLEQGIYNHMTTFRRVSNLWGKIMQLNNGDRDAIKRETITVRDYVVNLLDERGWLDPKQIEAQENE